MLKEFNDLKNLLYVPQTSKEVLSQMVLLEIKLLEIETRMNYATEVVKEMNNIIACNVCEKNYDKIEVLLDENEYDKMHFGTMDVFGLLNVNDETCVKENWGNKFTPMELPNISKEDYIIWDRKANAPKEDLDTVYHYTTLVDLINDGFKLNDEEFICVKELPMKWQILINNAIENCK